MMQIIDKQVGDLVAYLEKEGLADNTIIMFASDNGPHQEGGHKVDFLTAMRISEERNVTCGMVVSVLRSS